MSAKDNQINIRALTPDDWQEFAYIRLEALQAYPHYFGSTYARESLFIQKDWQDWLAQKDGAVFALYDSDKIIGVTGIVTSKDDPTGSSCILIASYIKPKYQGKGLSKKFYDARIDWAVMQPQLKKLLVSHREGNEPSRHANQKAGFRFINTAPKTWRDGTTSIEYNYELDLEELRRNRLSPNHIKPHESRISS